MSLNPARLTPIYGTVAISATTALRFERIESTNVVAPRAGTIAGIDEQRNLS